MNSKVKAKHEARAQIMKAMSHPTRLFVADVLSEGERCVCELTEMVGDDISTISKHLSVLRNAGIIAGAKRGTQVFCSLRIPCVLEFLSCVESVLKANAKAQAALAR